MRDFRRYQSMMESTIRAEVFTADPKLQKDPFKKGKEFGEKVGSGGFTRPGPTAAKQESGPEETAPAADATPSPEPTPAGDETGAASTASDAKPESSEGGEEGAEKA
jgi:hypothetical protein